MISLPALCRSPLVFPWASENRSSSTEWLDLDTSLGVRVLGTAAGDDVSVGGIMG